MFRSGEIFVKKIYKAFIKIFNSIFIGVLNRNLKIISSSTELNHFTKLHLSRRNLPIDIRWNTKVCVTMASSGEDTMNVLAPYNEIRHVFPLPASDLTTTSPILIILRTWQRCPPFSDPGRFVCRWRLGRDRVPQIKQPKLMFH